MKEKFEQIATLFRGQPFSALFVLLQRQDDIQKIADHYGDKVQIEKLREELNELFDEIHHSQNYCNGEITAHMQQEAADVFIMLAQFAYIVSKTPNDMIADTVKYKLDRQLKRMEAGE